MNCIGHCTSKSFFGESSIAPDYLIQLTTENNFVLTGGDNAIPLFKREANAASFLNNIDAVGKWLSTSELTNSTAFFKSSDFVFHLETIEGQSLNAGTLDIVKGKATTVKPNEEFNFSYQGDLQPAFRFSVEISPDSNLQSCYIGALYLESKFGIRHDLLPVGSKLL